MAIVTGALFSMTAKGTVGKALTYRKHRINQVAGFYSSPTNPNTLAQQNMRQFFTRLAEIYHEIYSGRFSRRNTPYDSYVLFARLPISGYNYFFKSYLPHGLSNIAILAGIDAVIAPPFLDVSIWFHSLNLPSAPLVHCALGTPPHDIAPSNADLAVDDSGFWRYDVQFSLSDFPGSLIGYIWGLIINPSGLYTPPVAVIPGST